MKTFFAFIFTTLSVLLALSVSAQTPLPLYWDPAASSGANLGGTGTWDTNGADANTAIWYNGVSDIVWTNGYTDAFFTGNAGTVTIAAGDQIYANDIYFTNLPGIYNITNSTGAEVLNVASNIDTGGSEDIIGVNIANSGTLYKNGNGILHLATANTLNNAVINQGDISVENNSSLGSSATVTNNGAALDLNGSASNYLSDVETSVTISGGITNNGSYRSMSGINTVYGNINLAGDSEIYINTNSSMLYYGGAIGNGADYNLLIAGTFGNIQFETAGINILGELIITNGGSCYFKSGISSCTYPSSVIESNSLLVAETDGACGTVPATLMTTNILIDGGTFDGYAFGNWVMNGNRGITVTTNGGTIEDTDTGGTWTTGNIYSISNTPVTFFAASGTTIQIANTTTDVLNIGTGTLYLTGPGSTKLQPTPQPVFSNIVINASIFTFNYDLGGGTPDAFGAVPSTFSPSNIFLTGSCQLHVGHSTAIYPTRGIYLAGGTETIEDVTGSGTATLDSTISGTGNLNCPLGKSSASTFVVLGTNNTYTGTTTIGADCTVTVGTGSAWGTLGTGNTTVNGVLAFNRTGTYTYGGTISGNSNIIKNASGTIILTGANTYAGGTTIGGGALLFNNTTGSGSGTGNVQVNSSGAVGGSGTISGSVTIASGGALALVTNTLSVGGNISLAGNITVQVNKSLTPTSGNAVVTGTLANSGTGTVTVTDLGSPLAVGDTFTLFNKAVTGGGTMTITGGGAGVTWNNNLAGNGTISVATVTASKPAINSVQINSGNFIFSGTNGTPGTNFIVSTSTNLLLPTSQWIPIATNPFLSNGSFFFTNAINPGNHDLFYLLQVQ